MHSANNPQSLEEHFIENFANLDIANYCRRDSGVHIVSGDYPLNYYLIMNIMYIITHKQKKSLYK